MKGYKSSINSRLLLKKKKKKSNSLLFTKYFTTSREILLKKFQECCLQFLGFKLYPRGELPKSLQHYSGGNNHLKDSVGIFSARNKESGSLGFVFKFSATTSILFNSLKVIITVWNQGLKVHFKLWIKAW